MPWKPPAELRGEMQEECISCGTKTMHPGGRGWQRTGDGFLCVECQGGEDTMQDRTGLGREPDEAPEAGRRLDLARGKARRI